MKKQMLNVVVTLSLISALSLAALAGWNNSVTANIPFDFMINGQPLPAGKYLVEPMPQGALAIRNWETKQAVLTIARRCDVNPDRQPQLTFHRYGNQYFLAKVQSNASASEVPTSKAERAAAKAGRDHLAKKDAKPEVVTVSAQIGQ